MNTAQQLALSSTTCREFPYEAFSSTPKLSKCLRFTPLVSHFQEKNKND